MSTEFNGVWHLLETVQVALEFEADHLPNNRTLDAINNTPKLVS